MKNTTPGNEKWLPEVKERVRRSTYESYRLHVESYLVPRIGGVKIQALKPDHLNKVYRELRKHGAGTVVPYRTALLS